MGGRDGLASGLWVGGQDARCDPQLGCVPGYRIAYEQVASSPGTAASSGPVIGAAASVDAGVQAAMEALASGADASTELARAVNGGNAAVRSYNKRI